MPENYFAIRSTDMLVTINFFYLQIVEKNFGVVAAIAMLSF